MDLIPVQQLIELNNFWDGLTSQHFVIVLALHCLFCASLAPGVKDKYVVHYLVSSPAAPGRARWSAGSGAHARSGGQQWAGAPGALPPPLLLAADALHGLRGRHLDDHADHGEWVPCA